VLGYFVVVNLIITLLSFGVLFLRDEIRKRYKILLYLLPMIISFLFWTAGTVFDSYLRTGKADWMFFTMLAGPELIIILVGGVVLTLMSRLKRRQNSI
jgi:hypothetical protein